MKRRFAAAAVIGLACMGWPMVTAAAAHAAPAPHPKTGAAAVGLKGHQFPAVHLRPLAGKLAAGPRPAAVTPLSNHFPGCYGDSRPIAAQGGSLDPSSFGAFYNCNQAEWTFEVQTSDAWTSRNELGDYQIIMNTDGDYQGHLGDNCGGANYDLILLQDPNAPGVFDPPQVLQFDASCNTTPVGTAEVSFLTNGIAISAPGTALGSAPSILWNGLIETRAEEMNCFVNNVCNTGHFAPLNSLAPDAITGQQPPGCTTTSTTSGEIATTSDSHKAAAALRRAGYAGVHDYGEGIVSFTGDPAAANRVLTAAGLQARVAPGHTFKPAVVSSPAAGTTIPPNDPGYSSQWNLAAINAPGAWSVTTGNNVVVADIDTGADYNQPDLAANLVNGFDEINNVPIGLGTSEVTNVDLDGHGTAVASVIAAVTNNGAGLASLGWNTKVMPIRVGFGTAQTSAQIAAGILWAADTTQHPGSPVKVINLSLGGPCPDSTIESAIQTAQSDGILVVAAAGNGALSPVADTVDGTDNAPSYPADEPNVVAVGATGADGFRAFYSDTGPYVTLMAPGGSNDNVAADDIPVLRTELAGGGTVTEAGTSFAAPQVSAAAALIWSVNPNLSANQVAEIIRSSATPLGVAGTDGLNGTGDGNNNTDIEYGTGMLNAGAALADTPSPAPGYGTFYSLPPTRILDTRTSLGHAGKVGPASTINLTVDNHGGVPGSGVAAVVLNVTVANPTAASYVTAWPTGQTRPTASNLNFSAGQTLPNLVTVKVGTNGQVSLYNAGGSTDLLADVAGYYGDGTAGTAGSTFVPVSPHRLLDTRPGPNHVGPIVGPIVGGTLNNNLPMTVQTGGVVPNGASAVVLNVTAITPTAASYLTAYPEGAPKPTASNLNYVAGQTVPNLVVVQLGANGGVSLFNGGTAANSVQVVVDLEGYFTAAGDASGSRFFPVVNHRILDTRTNLGGYSTPIGAAQSKVVAVAGQGGVIDCASAVVMNTTVTAPTAPSYLTVYPDGTGRPTASNLNFVTGQTVANLVSATVGTGGAWDSGGAVDMYNGGGNVQTLADVAGWYAGPSCTFS